MFEDFIKKNAMEDEIKPSKKRVKANCTALRSLIEQEELMNNNRKKGKIFKNPFALAATIAVCVCLTSVTAFAASNGLFTSIKKAFYNYDNALRASEPSEYAFIPEADSITGDGITINVTEAVVDSHSAIVFMDMLFENGVPQEVYDNSAYDYSSLCFESVGAGKSSGVYTDIVSVEDNVISLYICSTDIKNNNWKKDGLTIGVENFGYRESSSNSFPEFKKISDISGTINIPPEQIKGNGSLTAYCDMDGVNVQMELSILGINLTFDSMEDYDKSKGEFSRVESGIITPNELVIYMKDGTVYGNGENMDKAMDMLGGGYGGTTPDHKYYRYINFNMPADIEKISKISLGGYEFCFE